MEKFISFNPNPETKITVFSHQLLIENSYKDNGTNFSYALKPEIFNFNTKKRNFQENELKRKTKQNVNHVDKEKTKERNNFENEFKFEVDELQKTIQIFLSTFTNQQIFQPTTGGPDNNFNVDSIITESTSFPRFKAANTSEKLIKITVNNHEYIIPPFTKFFNYNIKDINEILLKDEKFDFIILDPPWRNKYIRRLKKSKIKSTAAYEMLDNDCVREIPIANLLTLNSLVAIWCTNSYQHQNAILNSFLPAWNLKLITKWYWVKMSVDGQTICNFNNEFGKKQPFEIIFIACPQNCQIDFKELSNYKKNILMSVPSLINSHKPPLIDIIRDYLPSIQEPKCLEIFARYLQPNFTSIGLEVLKLMDARLYNIKNE